MFQQHPTGRCQPIVEPPCPTVRPPVINQAAPRTELDLVWMFSQKCGSSKFEYGQFSQFCLRMNLAILPIKIYPMFLDYILHTWNRTPTQAHWYCLKWHSIGGAPTLPRRCPTPCCFDWRVCFCFSFFSFSVVGLLLLGLVVGGWLLIFDESVECRFFVWIWFGVWLRSRKFRIFVLWLLVVVVMGYEVLCEF